ncbi:MAG: hypothetical protein K1X55_10160 [Chitinophagales bacterium]|nr:hypothetical protein [Chitinophagales bacterium]
MNIIESTRQNLSSELITQLNTPIAGNDELVNKAIGMSITSIVAGILNKAAENNGLMSISNLLEKIHLAGFTDIMEEKSVLVGQRSLVVVYSSQEKVGGLVSMVAQSSGLPVATIAKWLPVLTIQVLRTLSEQKKIQGLDIKGLASLLLDQKEYIIETAPQGLTKFLGLTNFSSLGGTLNSYLGIPIKTGATQPKYEMETVQTTHAHETTAATNEKKLRWILPIVIILFIGYFLFKQFFG